jgi:hypothetical protein
MAEKGGASWQGDKEKHHLSVDNLTAHIYRDKQSWGFHIPDTRISMDDKPWPRGALSMAWIPAQDVGGKNGQRSDELRIRASNLNLSGLTGLQPMADKLAPRWAKSGVRRSLTAKSIFWRWIFRCSKWRKKRASRRTGATCPGSSGSCCQGLSISPATCRERGKRYSACQHDAGENAL